MYRVYWNLHKREYTVQHHVKGKGWRKLFGTSKLFLEGITFKVYESGRQRVLKEKKKNVHAYVIAKYICTTDTEREVLANKEYNWDYVVYNPYKYNSFVKLKDEAQVTHSDYVLLLPTGITTINKPRGE